MKKTMNNKGFSLVELIIVVAIMAVLVAVLLPQYAKYLDKTKAGADKQMAGELRTAIATTLLDPDIKDGCNDSTWTGHGTAFALSSSHAHSAKFWDNVLDIMGLTGSTKTGADVAGLLKLDTGATINVKVNTDLTVHVQVDYPAAKDDFDFWVE